MSRAVALAAGLLAAGCTGFDRQSSLDPAGPQAGRIHGLWDLFFWVCVVVYVLVVAFMLAAVFRRRPRHDRPVTTPPMNQELRKGIVVTACVVITTAILFVFLVADFLTGRGIDSLTDRDAPKILVTGHQWWWEVRYDDPDPSKIVTTANEVHIPVGRTVRFELRSTDVIHSFWVPNLHGKTDMIPGHPTNTFVRADHADTFWGQCAEFCGHQHANMRLLVVAEPEDVFRQWLEHQRQDAPQPGPDTRPKKGQDVFLGKSCVMCHAISGTRAQSRVGPDLTHVAGRKRIAAGTLETNRGNLGGWVADPHGVKPGVRMPPNPLAPDDLQALLDYLETLK